MDKRVLRQKELIDILSKKGMLPLKTLSSMLGVSEMTIRRDLKALENYTPLLDPDSADTANKRNKASIVNYNFLDELKKSNEQKERIGAFAASLIKKDDVIIIDTGSTTSHLLPYIPNEYNLTVLGYNTNVLFHLINNTDAKVLFCGGIYHKNTEMCESFEGLQFIERIRANKVFLSAAGIHRALGVTCANDYEIRTKQTVIKSSDEKILLADSSKFDRVRSSYFCDLSDITTIVTDTLLSKEWQDYILSLGIILHLV